MEEFVTENAYFYEDFEYILVKHPKMKRCFLNLGHLLGVSKIDDPIEYAKNVHYALTELAETEYNSALEVCKSAKLFMSNFKVFYL